MLFTFTYVCHTVECIADYTLARLHAYGEQKNLLLLNLIVSTSIVRYLLENI